MKERIDVSIDNRHVVSLLIAGIVVFGAVFILGVVVGKKLAGNDRAAHPPDALSALDQKAAATEPRKDPPLTFHEELTKKAPAAPEPPRTQAAVEVVVPAPPKARPEETSAPALVKVSEAPAPPERVIREPAATASSAPESHRLPAKEPPPRVESTPMAARAGAKERNLREAISRVEKKPASSPSAGGFTLQVSSTQMRAEADRVAARLRSKGYSPFIVQADVPGRGQWYRVRLGNFSTKDDAVRYLKDFRRETRLDGFVTNR